MPESDEPKGNLIEKNRLEALVDGIFAFAMTLLVTSLILPHNELAARSSAATLFALLPDFYHYIIAFFVLAAFWMGHHEQFRRIHHIDRRLLSLNILSLFFVTLVPFSTSFIGDYDGDFVSTVLFELNLMVLGLLFLSQWYYASRIRHLVSEELSELDIRERMNHNLILPAISLAGILLAVAGFGSSTMIYMATPFVEYAVDRYIRKRG
jgi:uncharacterized membrane protein